MDADASVDLRRIAVVGPSGAGKTTLAEALARRHGASHLELDGVFHQPGWTALDTETFRERVGAAVAADRWVSDGNYTAVADLVWSRATTLVWLDLPRTVTTRRVVARTIRRAVWRQELWNGNRERPREVVRLDDPERSIVAWAWQRHAATSATIARRLREPVAAHLDVVRLQSATEVADWLAGVQESR